MKYDNPLYKNLLIYVLLFIVFAIIVFSGKQSIKNNFNDASFDIIVGLNRDAYYAELFDPIYYSYGFETYDFSIPKLKSQKYKQCANYAIDLFPEKFINELTKSQLAHNEYFKNPSHDNAHKMLEQQYATAFAYIEDNEKFLKSILDESTGSNLKFILQSGDVLALHDVRDYILNNIKNGYHMLDKIEERDLMHHALAQYEIENYPSFSLKDTNTIDRTNLITARDAFLLLNMYVDASSDDYTARKKIKTMTVDDMFLAAIPLSCYNGRIANVYGVDNDFYAHMFYGDIEGDINLIDDYKQRGEWYMPFASCSCPFIEEDRINWYVIKMIHDDIENKPISIILREEQKFLVEPTYTNLQILSATYERLIKKAFVTHDINNDINIMWRRMNQINTKYFAYPNTLDDMNYEESNQYFSSELNDTCEQFQNFILAESLFHLNFMTWSDAVFIDDYSFFSSEEKRVVPNIIEIEDSRAFLKTEFANYNEANKNE